MTYFVIVIKMEVIDMKASVPTKLESCKLDLPRRRYEFSQMIEFCRFGEREICRILSVNLIKKTIDLAYMVKIRVEYL